MNSSERAEHFVTLFDSKFLPQGMALHSSLMSHAEPFHLWILCMDDLAESRLRSLSLPNVSLIPLKEVETKELLEVKEGRSRGEYCWTLTPFTPQFVFDRDPNIQRVTYLDADLYFFSNPRALLDEFSESGKHVLITEHAFSPEYEGMRKWGRFCVQFMTFRNTSESRKVMKWWQDRCIEWCFARLEDGRFGDQLYLENWPTQFEAEVHVLLQTDRTLAPWNVAHVLGVKRSTIAPVFFHFHGFRIISDTKILLYRRYRIGSFGQRLYMEYSDSVIQALSHINRHWGQIPILPERASYFDYVLRLIFRFLGRIQYRAFRL